MSSLIRTLKRRSSWRKIDLPRDYALQELRTSQAVFLRRSRFSHQN
uniref:Uncharacterized protein n=1 Tax=Arundo donax TaxID=35708 RepID=A0A0A9TCW6_ARUDO